jgi:hypothetical protein
MHHAFATAFTYSSGVLKSGIIDMKRTWDMVVDS